MYFIFLKIIKDILKSFKILVRMEIICQSCGCAIQGDKEGWYYCPQEDTEQYFSINNETNSKK